ncbi:MAG: transcription-repair coupling factor [Candidatus Firestonebacteria bacterium]
MKLNEIIQNIESGISKQLICGLYGGAKGYFLAHITQAINRPILIVTTNDEQAELLADDISTWLNFLKHPKEVCYFPALDILPEMELGPSKVILSQRLQVLFNIANNVSHPIITLSAKSLLQNLPSPLDFKSAVINLKNNEILEQDDFIEKLSEFGYERVSLIEKKGGFAVRGGIIDVFPLTFEDPVRCEFFDDTIESLRFFDVYSQLTIKKTKEICIPPVRIEKQNSSILEYFPQKKLIYIDEINLIEQELRKQNILDEFMQLSLDCLNDLQILYGSVFLQTSYIVDTANIEHKFVFSAKSISFATHGKSYSGRDTETNILQEFFTEIYKWQRENKRIIFFCNNDGERTRLQELLDEKDIYSNIKIFVGRLSSGFYIEDDNLIVIPDHEIFKRYNFRPVQRKLKFKEGRSISNIVDLKLNDFVVHIDYGIGKYNGIVKLNIEGNTKDFIIIEYDGQDKLYIPVDRIKSIQKYIGFTQVPLLNKLGTSVWERVKAQANEKIKEMASELLKLYAYRETLPGTKFSPDGNWQSEFEDAFLYNETPDQKKSIEEIKKVMESNKPMDLLLCGDVGYGKTEVAMRAAFKAVMDSRQVVVLVPTTILAEQHYNTFRERMADYPINIEMLSRFRSKIEQDKTIKKLANGTVDIVIGTHRLLQHDIQFKNIGLLIIDEEQRFGVKHKERLKHIKTTIDVLSMSATPIPRSLYISLSGVRKMSVINTPPEGRMPIQTYVLEYDEKIIRDAILRELYRNGQIFYVHNRVETIEQVAGKIRFLVPEAKIVIAHGQMREKSLEKVMIDFSERKFDVLIATTIIESGLDIPNANTIIIESADTYGLSDLYQLRGRVGRGKVQAYAYLTYTKNSLLFYQGMERLKAIEECDELGTGFKLALRDLEMRGAGNILGKEQHGHILAIGFDLYCELLKESVAELKGEKIIKAIDPEIDMQIDIYLPDDYIQDNNQKISVYKEIASISTEEEINYMHKKLRDIYGPIPDVVLNLLNLMHLKLIAKKFNIRTIKEEHKKFEIKFDFNEFNRKSGSINKKWLDRFKEVYKNYTISFKSDNNLLILYLNKPEKLNNSKKTAFLEEFFSQIKE